jgi:hypothetical protein
VTEARRVDPDTNIEAHAQALPPMSNTSSAIWTLDRWAMKEFRKLDVHFRVDWAVTFLWIAANPDRRVTEVAEGLGITGPAARSSSAYPGEMSRPGAKTEPDLFTLPEREIEPAPLPSRPVLLPDDLVYSLRLLADAELERLQAAVVNEVTRRGPPPGVALATEREVRPSAAPRPASSRRPRNSPSVPVAPAVTAQRHPSGLPGRTEAGDYRPSVRRTAVPRETSVAGRGRS